MPDASMPVIPTLHSPAAVRAARAERSDARSKQAVRCNAELECCMCGISGLERPGAHAFSPRGRRQCALCPTTFRVRSLQRAGPRWPRHVPAVVPHVASSSQGANPGLARCACSLALQKLDPAIVPLRGDEARVRPERARDQRESERGGRNEKRYKSPAQPTCCAVATSSETAPNAWLAAARP